MHDQALSIASVDQHTLAYSQMTLFEQKADFWDLISCCGCSFPKEQQLIVAIKDVVRLEVILFRLEQAFKGHRGLGFCDLLVVVDFLC